MTPDRQLKSIIASAASAVVRANARHSGERYALDRRIAKQHAAASEKITQRHEQRMADILGPLTEPMRAAVLAMVEVLEMEMEEFCAPDDSEAECAEAAE